MKAFQVSCKSVESASGILSLRKKKHRDDDKVSANAWCTLSFDLLSLLKNEQKRDLLQHKVKMGFNKSQGYNFNSIYYALVARSVQWHGCYAALNMICGVSTRFDA